MKTASKPARKTRVYDPEKQRQYTLATKARKKALGLSRREPLDEKKRAEFQSQKAANLVRSAKAREGRAAQSRERWPEAAMGKDRAYRRRIKAQAYELHGGACADCGFDNPLALQFDHIEPVRRSRANGKRAASDETYRGVVSGALNGKVRLVCANCHAIRGHTEGHFAQALRCH